VDIEFLIFYSLMRNNHIELLYFGVELEFEHDGGLIHIAAFT